MSMIVLDTMGAESHYNVNGVLYDTVLGDKLSRDEMSRQNLDLIFNNRIYDPGCIYNFNKIADTLLKGWQGGSDKVVSLLESNRKAVQTAIDDMVEILSE